MTDVGSTARSAPTQPEMPKVASWRLLVTMGGGGAIAYATAKGGVMTMTRGLAKELGPRKIRVNCVAPGMINTTFHDTFTKPEIRQKVASMTPLGREGAAPEVAELVAFLATDASSFVNGVAVDINGGILFS